MIAKRVRDITKQDIEALIKNGVREGRTIEYKESLPGASDGDKKEFLADVSSFANTFGGDLLYGTSEERDENGRNTGVPVQVASIGNLNTDFEIRRLDSLIQDGISPDKRNETALN